MKNKFYVFCFLMLSSNTLSANTWSPQELQELARDELKVDNNKFLTDEEMILAKSLVAYDSYSNNALGITYETAQYRGEKVKGTEYFKDYNNNEIKADAKYKDKPLFIKGYVNSISRDMFDKPFLSLNGGGYLNEVMAMFEENEENIKYLSEVNKKDIVDLYCIGGGLTLISPILKKCIPRSEYDIKFKKGILDSLEYYNNATWAVGNSIGFMVGSQYAQEITESSLYLLFAKISSYAGISCKKISKECYSKINLEAFSKGWKIFFEKTIGSEKYKKFKDFKVFFE